MGLSRGKCFEVSEQALLAREALFLAFDGGFFVTSDDHKHGQAYKLFSKSDRCEFFRGVALFLRALEKGFDLCSVEGMGFSTFRHIAGSCGDTIGKRREASLPLRLLIFGAKAFVCFEDVALIGIERGAVVPVFDAVWVGCFSELFRCCSYQRRSLYGTV